MMTSEKSYLSEELATFERRRKEFLVENEGKHAVIHGESVSFWDTYQDAIKYGYGKYGLSPFLVKQVLAIDHVNFAIY